MKKKSTVVVSILVVLACIVSGCGSRNNANSDKLVIWTNMSVEADTLQKLADSWGVEKGYKVEVIHQSPSVQQFAQAANSVDGPDAVIGIPNDQLADYVNAGLVAETPSDLYIDDEFSDASIQACYTNGKRVAAPLAVETVTLFYNTDRVESVPDTWEELVKVAGDYGGIQFDATSIYYDLGFIRACGGYIFKYEDGVYDVSDIGLANEGAIQAYEFINSLCSEYGYVSANVTADIARSNFQNGETAFYIGGPWDIDGFDSAGTHYAVTEMPTFNGNAFVTPVGTQVAFVSSKTEKQEMAWDFIMYVIENGALDLYKIGDRIPAKLSEQSNEVIQSDKVSREFINQINNGEPMPTVSELGQLWSIHSNNIKSMFLGEIQPKEMAENIVSQLVEALKLMNSGK